MAGEVGGPSDRAKGAADRLGATTPGEKSYVRSVLAAAHDPALGLDRSVCLRDAAEVFKRLTRDPLNPPEPDDFEREFGGGNV